MAETAKPRLEAGGAARPGQRRWPGAVPLSERARGGLGVLVVALSVLVIHAAILIGPDARDNFPWGSDTLGHVFRAEWLRQAAADGSVYPALLPDWYLGTQLLRYYPPLPYYVLMAAQALAGPVAGANWFLAACALAGGLAWLPYRRWLGWLPAIAGGVLFVGLPDNLRVAFAEGNLPRVLATALLPLAFYLLLRAASADGTRWHAAGLALTFTAILLSHAMMAAIYAAGAVLFCLAALAFRAGPPRRLALAGASVALGLLLGGAWLLPSLTGGITELNSAAVADALATVSLRDLLTPWRRVGDPEALYVGVALLVLGMAALMARPGRRGILGALLVTGLTSVLISTPSLSRLMQALPLHNLLWPVRFLGLGSFLLLLALMWRAAAWTGKSWLLAAGVVALLAADSAGSLFLIRLRPPQPDTLAISQALRQSPGWRQATLDLSRLGSEPSYFYATLAGREQLYGWAYQGAHAAPTVAALNEAVQAGFTAYLADRLALYGTDDVVLLNGLPRAGAVAEGLEAAGFERVYQGALTDLFHRDGTPRAALLNSPGLGIGRGAQNLAYLFPQIVLGTSANVQDYDLAELTRYQTVVLSGFTWSDRAGAETLIQQAASAGVNVVVDMTNAPQEPLAAIPRFLNVWGEAIILDAQPQSVQGEGGSYALQPPGGDGALWYTHTPQGLEHVTLSLDYLGEHATVLGYNVYGLGRVWFIGLNLPYHATLTQDPAAVDLLAGVLRLPPAAPADYATVPLQAYRAGPDGYQFEIELDEPATLLVPVAFHDGLRATVDGAPVELQSFERLVAFNAPSGAHAVELRLRPTAVYGLGWLASGLGLTALAGLWMWGKRR